MQSLLAIYRDIFWKKKKNNKSCRHRWVLNDVYGKTINSYVEVIVEDRYVVICINCHKEKHLDEFDYKRMVKNGLLRVN